MFEETLYRLQASLTRDQKRDIRMVLLLIQSNAQASFGECPFCECPIGASQQHYANNCPFRKMDQIVNTMT